jgi:hypothetical protein
MVLPENQALFREFEVDGIRLFIENKLLVEIPCTIEFLMPYKGYVTIQIEERTK